MKYIQSRKIIHLNLIPANILISEDGTIKISDFKNAEKVNYFQNLGNKIEWNSMKARFWSL